MYICFAYRIIDYVLPIRLCLTVVYSSDSAVLSVVNYCQVAIT